MNLRNNESFKKFIWSNAPKKLSNLDFTVKQRKKTRKKKLKKIHLGGEDQFSPDHCSYLDECF